MKSYLSLNAEERKQELAFLEAELSAVESLNLQLNMARGKPSPAQLDYVDSCFAKVDYTRHISEEGVDCRNYGELFGIVEMRRLFAELLKTETERVWCLGSSSLTIMHDVLCRCMLFPLPGSDKPWLKYDQARFICPVPGYDRHFAITENFGVDMIPVPITDEGLDTEKIAAMCAEDPTIKGMWLVPMYSNPDGTSFSEKQLRQLFSMKAAPDFRIFADMAYCAHHLNEPDEPRAPLFPLLRLAEEEGNPDRVFIFASTSKITYAGGGIACLAASEGNQAWLKPRLAAQMISADKLNMLRHAEVIEAAGGIDAMMKPHRRILREKFELLDAMLRENLAPYGIASWRKPLGGYFVALNLYPGTAKALVSRCRALGVQLTAAGSVFPYGQDPDDSCIRLAPSFPETDELKEAIRVVCLAARYEALRRIDAQQ